MQKRLFVDLDGTVARFHDDILDNEGHVQLEKMYEEDFFRNLKPFEYMVEAIRQFIKLYPEVEVYSLSAAQLGDPPGFVKQKDLWLNEHLPEIDGEHRIYPEMGTNKADYIPNGITALDTLLDDYNKNLHEWEAAGGNAVKCKNNINHRGLGAYGGEVGNLWGGSMVFYDKAPGEIVKHLARLMELPEREVEFLSQEEMEQLQGVTMDEEIAALGYTCVGQLCEFPGYEDEFERLWVWEKEGNEGAPYVVTSDFGNTHCGFVKLIDASALDLEGKLKRDEEIRLQVEAVCEGKPFSFFQKQVISRGFADGLSMEEVKRFAKVENSPEKMWEEFGKLSHANQKALYAEAVEHFNQREGYDIEKKDPEDSLVDVKDYKEELIYCYQQKKNLIDFYFWTSYEELLGKKVSFEEYSLYHEALKHFSEKAGVDIETNYVKAHGEELIYCYQQKKDLIDFDFWTCYEELLGETLSFEEYLFVDQGLDGSPEEINPETRDGQILIEILEERLNGYRGINKSSLEEKIQSATKVCEGVNKEKGARAIKKEMEK